MQNDTYTNQEIMLGVGGGHTLYVVDWGNKDAITPTIFLHGGPGSSSKDKHKSVFNPNTHRVIFFDQRGAGKSTPSGLLEQNTTQDLLEDITKVADKLEISTFNLHGSSWGSTLALAYSITHPERVANVIIGGVFTGSKAESDWIDKGYFKTFYPEAWQAYLDRTPSDFHEDPSAYHFEKIENGTPDEQKASAYAYECMESGIIKLDDRFMPENFDEYDADGMRIEMHYLKNNCFLPENYILDNSDKIIMPLFIVQGRYDMVCPPITAYKLHKKVAHSKLYWTLAGHHTEHEGENIFRSILAGL
ncbi:MAG: alpha/beta fold hydrolase [Candidatus Microsaccharimonas sp.]